MMSSAWQKRIEIAKPYFDEKEQNAVAEVIKSGWVSQGPKVKEFEEVFARYVGARHAIAVTSCTTALHLSLVALRIGGGDEVIVPSLSFIATANSVVHSGAKPVFVDVNPYTCNMDAEKIEKLITDKTVAIMPVHQMGLPADLGAIGEIAVKYRLRIIEDAACAIGSEYKRKKIGSHGNIACFSFHPRKIITTGEGGMITTDDGEIAAKLSLLRHQGMSVSDMERHSANKIIIESYPQVGFNYRMTDIQAAIGLVQMEKLPDILNKRRKIAERYDGTFKEIKCIRIPEVPDYAVNNYQSYSIELLGNAPVTRNSFMEKMLDAGIHTRRGIMAIHREPCYVMNKVELPNTDRISENSLILPLHPSMSDEEIQHVIKCVHSFLS